MLKDSPLDGTPTPNNYVATPMTVIQKWEGDRSSAVEKDSLVRSLISDVHALTCEMEQELTDVSRRADAGVVALVAAVNETGECAEAGKKLRSTLYRGKRSLARCLHRNQKLLTDFSKSFDASTCSTVAAGVATNLALEEKEGGVGVKGICIYSTPSSGCDASSTPDTVVAKFKNNGLKSSTVIVEDSAVNLSYRYQQALAESDIKPAAATAQSTLSTDDSSASLSVDEEVRWARKALRRMRRHLRQKLVDLRGQEGSPAMVAAQRDLAKVAGELMRLRRWGNSSSGGEASPTCDFTDDQPPVSDPIPVDDLPLSVSIRERADVVPRHRQARQCCTPPPLSPTSPLQPQPLTRHVRAGSPLPLPLACRSDTALTKVLRAHLNSESSHRASLPQPVVTAYRDKCTTSKHVVEGQKCKASMPVEDTSVSQHCLSSQSPFVASTPPSINGLDMAWGSLILHVPHVPRLDDGVESTDPAVGSGNKEGLKEACRTVSSLTSTHRRSTTRLEAAGQAARDPAATQPQSLQRLLVKITGTSPKKAQLHIQPQLSTVASPVCMPAALTPPPTPVTVLHWVDLPSEGPLPSGLWSADSPLASPTGPPPPPPHEEENLAAGSSHQSLQASSHASLTVKTPPKPLRASNGCGLGNRQGLSVGASNSSNRCNVVVPVAAAREKGKPRKVPRRRLFDEDDDANKENIPQEGNKT